MSQEVNLLPSKRIEDMNEQMNPTLRIEQKSELQNPNHDLGWELKIPVLTSWCVKHTAKRISMDLCCDKIQQGLLNNISQQPEHSSWLGRREQDNTLQLLGCHSSQWHWEVTASQVELISADLPRQLETLGKKREVQRKEIPPLWLDAVP